VAAEQQEQQRHKQEQRPECSLSVQVLHGPASLPQQQLQFKVDSHRE
jgi:hypothetical protein